MRSSFTCVVLLALAACGAKDARRSDTAAPATATLAGTATPDAAAVRQLIDSADARFGAAALKGDTATLASFYADDAMFMDANMPTIRGHDAIAKAFGAMVATMKPTSFKLQTTDLIVSGEYAIETGTYDVSNAAAKGAKPSHAVGKFLVIWRKQPDGRYKIIRDIGNSDQAPGK
ncbi:MAG TPA: DUF4440 domain-containing protein [Gemmatimonadaceae bacterium]|jgi:uncharacterized protein (TIGR02246 family)